MAGPCEVMREVAVRRAERAAVEIAASKADYEVCGPRIAFSSDRDRLITSNPFFPFVRQREGDIYVMDLDGRNPNV